MLLTERILNFIRITAGSYNETPYQDIMLSFYEEIHPRKIKGKLDILAELGLIVVIDLNDELKYRWVDRRRFLNGC